ncbi:hypothetical protein A3A45_00850, partial [Candidatus Daviesbacteria bacterium RIFCSPLOWO2_01_FULL_36_8]
NLTEGTIKTTQEKIINSLHLTFETFSNSSYLRQGHADEFTTKGPTDRKRILADILGLSHYDKLEEKAKEKAKTAAVKLQLLEYQLIELEAELSQKDQSKEKKAAAEKKISEVEIKINILEKELKVLQEKKATLSASNEQQIKLKQTLSELQSELTEILTQGKNRAEKIKQLKEQLLELPALREKLKQKEQLEEQKEEFTKNSQKKMGLQKELSDLMGPLSLKNQEKQNLDKKLEELRIHIDAIAKDSAKCPTCGQIINADQKQKVKLEYLEEQKKISQQLAEIKTIDEELKIEKVKAEIGSINIDDTKYQEISEKLKDIFSLQEKYEKLITAEATQTAEEKVILELRSLFTNKKSQVEKLEAEVKQLPDLEKTLSESEKEVLQKESELNLLRLEEKDARNLLGAASELISRVAQLEKVAKQKSEEKISLQKDTEMFEELSVAFGKKGIQAMIIEAAIPEIEEESNKLLGRLSEGRMKITLETQKETKTKMSDGEKGIVETLDIIISDEMGERPYEMYSGGEAFRVNFAIRLAISKLLTHRAGAKLQFLVIDEGFGSQDAPGRARLVEAIDAIKDDFEKIIIITHIEELKEEFPVRIEVSKNNVGSTFEVIGA